MFPTACRRVLFAVLVIVATASTAVMPLPATFAQDPATETPGTFVSPEIWSGSVSLPNGVELELSVTFRQDDDGTVSATMSIPAQGFIDGAVSKVKRTETDLAFTIAQASAEFTAKIDEGGASAQGNLSQGGMQFPLTLQRLDAEAAAAAAAGPNRPQTPQPPFPYTELEVEYKNANDGTTLAGTITIPQGDGPFPGVVMITGSGAQDRDESLMGHKPFWVIADHLSRNGIAVLRADDRGVGGSSGDVLTATLDEFVGDALAGVKTLGEHAKVDASRVGVVGHSEGGIVGPAAAALAPDKIDFVVMLAGTGLRGDAILRMQVRAGAEYMGAPEAMIEDILVSHRALTDLLIADADTAAVRDAIAALTEKQGVSRDSEGFDEAVDGGLAMVDSRWFRSFVAYDPAPTLTKVTCPVLAVNGSLDFQVPAEENLKAIRESLTAGGNTNVTIKNFEGLNHLFQEAESGMLDEYAQIEMTFSPDVLKYMSNWITRVTQQGTPVQ